MKFFSEKVNSLLSQMEQSSSQYWNIPREVAQILYSLVIFGKAKKVLEIGTSNGYSGIWLAKALQCVQGKLITIESHAERFDLAKGSFMAAEVTDVITQVKGHAPEVFSENNDIAIGGFDLIFMDATKKQTIAFIDGALPLLASGGLIVVDNVLSHWDEMQSMVEHVEKVPNVSSQLMKIGDGLLFIYNQSSI